MWRTTADEISRATGADTSVAIGAMCEQSKVSGVDLARFASEHVAEAVQLITAAPDAGTCAWFNSPTVGLVCGEWPVTAYPVDCW